MSDPAAPSAPQRLPSLDGWRGLSILLVLIGHLTVIDRAAHVGVEMFFVLSGRLMAHILVDRRQSIGTFVWRRIGRVWPALWSYVGLVTLGLGVSYLFGDRRHALVGALAAVGFVANYVAGSISMPYFDHSWSLAVEEHGYLLLAVIVLLVARRRGAATAIALALSAAAMANGWWQIAGGADAYYTYLRTDVRAASLLLPFALALVAGVPAVAVRLARLPWLSPLALAAAIPFATLDPGWARFTIGTALLSIAVVAIDHAPASVLRMLAWRPLLLLAAASFSLYLWQQPFMLLHRAGGPAWLCFAGALALGGWSYRRIERPWRLRLAAATPGSIAARLAQKRKATITGTASIHSAPAGCG